MKTPNLHRRAVAFVLTLGVPALLAQPTAPSSNPPEPDQETVTLSPFTVSTTRDNGYTAVDSLAGGRQSAPIRVTPAAMSSMTRAFIDDLSLTNVQDALRWSLNVVPTDFRNGISGGSGGEVFNFWSVSIRGDSHVQGGNPPTKNYFPTFMPIDTYNIDRLEVDSGPNSILFGIGDIGGSLTAYTKQARFDKDFTDLVAMTSNYGGYRVTADVNQALGRVALRVNALAANERGWRDGDKHKKYAVDLAGTIKLWRNTEIRFEAEGWKEEKTVFAQSITDGESLWNGTTNSPTWGAAIPNSGANPLTTAGAPGVTAMNAWGGPANYYVWTPSVGLMNWAGGARTMGTGDIGAGAFLRPKPFTFGPTGTVIPALPNRHFAITPADGLLKPEALDFTVNLDQRINDNCEFEISGYRYQDDAHARNFEGAGGGLGFGVAIDLNRQLPNGQPNPNYGKPYSDMFLDEQIQNHWVNEVRGQFSYHFNANVWNVPLKQLLSVSAGEQVTEYDARQHQATFLNNYDPANWTQSMIWGRIYWDAPQRALGVPGTVINGQNIRYIALPFNWYDFNSKQTIKYGGAFSQTRLWNDRLNISLGIRRDKYDNWKVGLRGPSNPPTLSNGAGNTYSAGAVGYVTEWLGIVANISENYQPAAGGLAPSLYGATFGPSFGKGKSVGLRVSTKDGRYYASLNYYVDTSKDVIGGDSPDFQGLWNDYFTAGGTNTNIGPAGTVTGGPGTYHANMSYTDTYDVKYKGWEFETTASPTKNIRLQVHYSQPKGQKENDGPNAARYFAQNLAIWQAAAGGTSPASTKLATDISNAQKSIQSVAQPTITAHLVKYMANAFVTYSFTEDALKGLDVGGGVTALGRQYGNPSDIINGTRTLSPSYATYSALVRYTRDFAFGGRTVRGRLQMNVDNLFGKDTLIFISYQAYGTNQLQAMDYNQIAPRKFTFTASLDF